MAGVLNFSEAAALALHSVELLAGNAGNPMTAGELAGVLQCSPSHLAKVMQRLVRAGIVASSRGPGGGFRLGARAAQSSLLDVYEAIDGKIAEAQCMLGHCRCTIAGCWYGKFAADVGRRVRAGLAKRRLSALAGPAAEASHK